MTMGGGGVGAIPFFRWTRLADISTQSIVETPAVSIDFGGKNIGYCARPGHSSAVGSTREFASTSSRGIVGACFGCCFFFEFDLKFPLFCLRHYKAFLISVYTYAKKTLFICECKFENDCNIQSHRATGDAWLSTMIQNMFQLKVSLE